MKSHEKPPLHPKPPRFLPFSQGSSQGSSQKVPRSDLLSQLFQKFFGRGPHHGLRRGHSDLGWWMGEDSATKTGDHEDLNKNKNMETWTRYLFGCFMIPNWLIYSSKHVFPWVYGNEINIVQWGNHLVQWWWWWWSMGIIVRLSLLMIIV